jgi:hypothetical protein
MMPQGYEVWEDQNPPPGDSPLNQSGYLWSHPTAGKLFYNPKTKQFVPVSDEQWGKFAKPKPEAAAPSAEDQAEALSPGGDTDNEAAEAGEAPALSGGVGVEETTTAAGLRETIAQRNERLARQKAARGVAAANAQARAAASGTMGGLSLTERAAATKLMQTEGISEEEAVARIKGTRAEDQANALGGEEPQE